MLIDRDTALVNNLKRYYDGTKCNFGHDSERYSISGECVICVKYHGRDQLHKGIYDLSSTERSRIRRQNPKIREQENARRRERIKSPDIRNKRNKYTNEYNKSHKGKIVKGCKVILMQSITKPKTDRIRKCDTLVGYNHNDLKGHIEKYMIDGMSWDNRGTYWCIVHRNPPSRLYDKGIHDISVINQLENLRPMLIGDSPAKRTKTEQECFELYPDIAKQYPTMPEFKQE